MHRKVRLCDKKALCEKKYKIQTSNYLGIDTTNIYNILYT